MTERPIPAGFRQYAYHMALRRVAANEVRYHGRPEKRRLGLKDSLVFGRVTKELWTDAIGILAELIARHSADVDPDVRHFVASAFVKGEGFVEDDHDLTVNGKRISVKGSEGDSPLRYNVDAMERSRPDKVLFVRFLDGRRYVIEMIDPAVVCTWPIQDRYSRYYERAL